MKTTNVAELRNGLRGLLAAVARGEEVEVRRRNVPIARIVPCRSATRNRTKLGCGRGTAVVTGDLTAPALPAAAWDMLKD